MINDCIHCKNVLVRSCGKKKVKKISTFQNVLRADAERTSDAERMRTVDAEQVRSGLRMRKV